jgi:hypothetical protein
MKNLKTLSLLLFLALSPILKAELKLKPFETDGCTMFVEGTKEKPNLWKHCCVEHDLRYWFGGSESDMDTADLRLKSCVQKVAGDNWAALIYNGVRVGHYSPIKNKYYWSWAWSVKREKVALNSEETQYVVKLLRNLSLKEISVEEFIKTNFPSRIAP